MYRIIFSILFALTVSFSAPDEDEMEYVTLDIIVTDRIYADDTSVSVPGIGETYTCTFLYDPTKNGVIQYYDQPDYEMGIFGQPYVNGLSWYRLKDHPFQFPPKYGISSMRSMYSPCKNDTCRFLRFIDEEHMFTLKFDDNMPDTFTVGTGCELVALKEPYHDTLIYSQNPCPWDPIIHSKSGDQGLYAGFMFKFKVTRVAKTPPYQNIISTIYVPDVNSNGLPTLASLYVDQNNGNSIVSIQDINSGEVIGKIAFFNNNWLPKELSMVQDINGNYVFDLSVLAISKKTGEAQVRIKDGETGELLKKLNISGLGPQPEPPDKHIK